MKLTEGKNRNSGKGAEERGGGSKYIICMVEILKQSNSEPNIVVDTNLQEQIIHRPCHLGLGNSNFESD